jgi:hypothetical protein
LKEDKNGHWLGSTLASQHSLFVIFSFNETMNKLFASLGLAVFKTVLFLLLYLLLYLIPPIRATFVIELLIKRLLVHS